jgi:hypothetical protein
MRRARLRITILATALGTLLPAVSAAQSINPPLASVSYTDQMLSRVTIRWRCDPAPDGTIVYRGYIDAFPAANSELHVEGRLWLGDSGLLPGGEYIAFAQTNVSFSAASGVPREPAQSYNVMPFRILRKGDVCGSRVSIYWWPISVAEKRPGPRTPQQIALRFPINRAHEFPLR